MVSVLEQQKGTHLAKNDIGGTWIVTTANVLVGFGVLVGTISNDCLVIRNELFRRLPSQACVNLHRGNVGKALDKFSSRRIGSGNRLYVFLIVQNASKITSKLGRHP
jgi:hypothetical protein